MRRHPESGSESGSEDPPKTRARPGGRARPTSGGPRLGAGALLAFALAWSAAEAGAEERSSSPSFALGVRGGATAATASGSVTGAPMMELDARLRWDELRFELFGGLSGWSLPSGPGYSSATELFAAAGARVLIPVSESWRAVLGGGPALAVTSGPGRSNEASPALYLAPGFEMGTRRRSLTLELGLRSWILMDAVRLGAVAGVSYRF